MASKDLRIRLLGRPQVTEDSTLGFRKITRRYVIEGIKASKQGLLGTLDKIALFGEMGDADEEFIDHYLVNQRIEPSKSVDKAYLVREYAHVRDTWNSESITESGDLKRLTRRYVVLRKGNHQRGYSNAEWEKHPENTGVTIDTHTPNIGQYVELYRKLPEVPYQFMLDGRVMPETIYVNKGQTYGFSMSADFASLSSDSNLPSFAVSTEGGSGSFAARPVAAAPVRYTVYL